MNRYTYWFLFLIVWFSKGLYSQEYELQQITVTANRTPSEFRDLSREVIVIDATALKNVPVQSIQDLFTYIQSVDSKKRGPSGVQTDIAIRGGSFEQTLIMIDGIKISDPQTAHHNMNLPINIEDIDRVEIVKGQGSKSFGPNALAGTINFITKNARQKKLTLNTSGGQFGYYNAGFSFAFPYKQFGTRISFSRNKSDGYRYNTHFKGTTASLGTSIQVADHSFTLSGGLNEKEFGANSFYSDRFPSQWEATKVFFMNLSSELKFSGISVTPKLYMRKHNDDYILDFNRPEWYRNKHETLSRGAEIQFQFASAIGTSAIGGEISKDDIESTNLGDHNRTKGGIFLEQVISPTKRLKVVIGGFSYNYDKWGWKLWPGIDAGYNLSDNLRIYGSAGKSFRIPSFTELYYSSPAQKGNSKLQPEEAVSYELGVSYINKLLQANVSLFRRYGSNIIDWVKETEAQPWSAMNIAESTTDGLEAGVSVFRSNDQVVKLSYTFLEIDKTFDIYRSLYLLDHLKHQFILNIMFSLFEIKQSWAFRYENRIDADNHFITDLKLMYGFNDFDFFIESTNLFNTSYYNIPGIPLPGRWITGGVKYTIE